MTSFTPMKAPCTRVAKALECHDRVDQIELDGLISTGAMAPSHDREAEERNGFSAGLLARSYGATPPCVAGILITAPRLSG